MRNIDYLVTMQCPARKIMGAGIHVNDIFPCIIRVNIVTANQTTPWQKKVLSGRLLEQANIQLPYSKNSGMPQRTRQSDLGIPPVSTLPRF